MRTAAEDIRFIKTKLNEAFEGDDYQRLLAEATDEDHSLIQKFAAALRENAHLLAKMLREELVKAKIIKEGVSRLLNKAVRGTLKILVRVIISFFSIIFKLVFGIGGAAMALTAGSAVAHTISELITDAIFKTGPLLPVVKAMAASLSGLAGGLLSIAVLLFVAWAIIYIGVFAAGYVFSGEQAFDAEELIQSINEFVDRGVDKALGEVTRGR